MTSNNRPQIRVDNRHMREISEDAWSVLVGANDPPEVFQRGRLMMDIILDDNGDPRLRTLRKPAVKGRLDRIADFVRVEDGALQPARPPADVVTDMMVAKILPLPLIRGISRAPMFSPAGVLATTSGYQQETGYFYHPQKGLRIPDVPQRPNPADVLMAKIIILDDLLSDFPFVGDADIAHALSIMLLPFVRPMIDGPTPLNLIESPLPGTGKDLLAEVLTYPALARIHRRRGSG